MNNDVPFTCFSPDRQVFILLNVQHELKSITHSSLGGDEGRASSTPGIKGITLPIASEDLKDTQGRFILNTTALKTGVSKETYHPERLLNNAYPLGVSVRFSFR